MSPSQVFDCSSVDGSGLLTEDSQFVFLDEFRVMAISRHTHLESLEILVFNTLVPQGHPRGLRRLNLPPKYRDTRASIHVDPYRSLGPSNSDGPITVDPAQAIVLVNLVSRHAKKPQVLLILRVQPLIEHVCSMSTYVQTPWDEWGRDSMVMEIFYGSFYLAAVHGSRVLGLLRGEGRARRTYTFDFGLWGSDTLHFSYGNDGGAERRAVFEVGYLMFEECNGVGTWGGDPIGDSLVSYGVSLLPHSSLEVP
jgi:hypothetical protein